MSGASVGHGQPRASGWQPEHAAPQVGNLCYGGTVRTRRPRRALGRPALGDRRGLDLHGERGPVHRPRSSGTGAGHTVRRMIVAVMP